MFHPLKFPLLEISWSLTWENQDSSTLDDSGTQDSSEVVKGKIQRENESGLWLAPVGVGAWTPALNFSPGQQAYPFPLFWMS